LTIRRGGPRKPFRGGGKNSSRRGDRGYPPKKVQSIRKRRLNLKRMTEFKWEINQLMNDLPENQRGTVKGSLIAKADKLDINAALDFVQLKIDEGVLNKEMADRIADLLLKFSTYR
jgi:hypothetical protein